ncbi:hypothetical protein [Streptomyces sp. cg35]|uniref:hypothetical protein n=1 Tax=Streptomyces sp. cg35 TaxID=3421650 RepID=UPI003D1872AF
MSTLQRADEDRAGRLGLEVWKSVLPHAEGLLPYRERRHTDDVPAAARPERVTSADQLRVGDLVLVLDASHRGESRVISDLTRLTVRELFTGYEAVRRVVTVSPASITVHSGLNIPMGGWGSCDPDKIAEPRHADAYPPERMMINAKRAVLVRLGTAADLVEACRNHASYNEWRAAYQEAAAEDAQARDEAKARRKVRDAKRAPLLAAAEAFNTLAGDKLVRLQAFGKGLDEVGEVEILVKWLADGGRLVTYVAGLHATGKLSDQEHVEALGYLRTLGLCTDDDIPTA